MTQTTIQTRTKALPVHMAMPQEVGILTLKSLAFAAALVAGSSTSAHASSIGSIRLDSSSTGLTVIAREQNVQSALEEIKRKAGLTWAELAGLFQVSRRAVHSWANGATVRAANASRVNELLDRVRKLERLPSFKVRAELLSPQIGSANTFGDSQVEPPILMADNTPFVHQLELRPAKSKVKRG